MPKCDFVKFCEVFKNTYFYGTSLMVASLSRMVQGKLINFWELKTAFCVAVEKLWTQLKSVTSKILRDRQFLKILKTSSWLTFRSASTTCSCFVEIMLFEKMALKQNCVKKTL